MACKESFMLNELISDEFDLWQESCNNGDIIVLVEIKQEAADKIDLHLLLGCEYDVTLHIPAGYPDYEDSFFVESDSAIQFWTVALNEFLLDSQTKLNLADVLDKAVQLYSTRDKGRKETNPSSDEEEENNDEDDNDDDEEEEEEEEQEDFLIVADDEAFTTEWDLKVARKKMRWSKKEPIVREMMQKKRMSQGLAPDTKPTGQIFTSHAASGILTNDLIKIMECEEECGFSAEPVGDNIYHWRVRLVNFEPGSELARDLEIVKLKHNYNYIELEMTFEIDLFPFYPPLVKVIRPRLQGSMMQRISNIEMLQLSYWSPTKDMKTVIGEMKAFLQQWARIDVDYDRNALNRCPYLDIEHHLLTLAQVSEVTPRANQKYNLDELKMKELKSSVTVAQGVRSGGKDGKEKTKTEYWAKGVGYGHNNRPGWDIDAYIAAQKEKDNKIESALGDILVELKALRYNNIPSRKSSMTSTASTSSSNLASTSTSDMAVDEPKDGPQWIEDMYSVIEGSALIPCIEQYLKVDSFLEISRHSVVYTVIVNVIKELAHHKELVPLLCSLPNQHLSVFLSLEHLDKMASVMLQQIHKPANGFVPEGVSDDSSEAAAPNPCSINMILKKKLGGGCSRPQAAAADGDKHHTSSNEEKLAREFTSLFQLVKRVVQEQNLQHLCASSQDCMANGDMANGAAVMGAKEAGASLQYSAVESHYRDALRGLQFASCMIPLEGSHSHHYASAFKHASKQPHKSQVIRIAQELSSLSTSLPLNLSSSIFVRTDDDKLPLLRALITGPEGTPYSSGCFLFDVHFPPTYPKTPPTVNLQTTGGGTVRFNPNLYKCGTVCLSLLGTWQGQNCEEWNEKTSTLLQVLVSIQSLILVPDPYFNEPGYEQSIGTDSGRKMSEEYNKNVRYNNINYAMVAQLQNPPPGFEDIIKTHFYLRQARILEEVKEWMKNNKCSKMASAVTNLKKELKKLEPPKHMQTAAK